MKPQKRSTRNAGEVKQEPEEVLFVIMTNKDMHRYQTKSLFDEDLEKFKKDESVLFIRTEKFNNLEQAEKAYETVMAKYNRMSEKGKKYFESKLVDLFITEDSSKSKGEPPKKLARRSFPSIDSVCGETKQPGNKDKVDTKQNDDSGKVVALFTPLGAQYFPNENLAHFALEDFRKEHADKKLNAELFRFTSFDHAFEGYEDYKNQRAVMKMPKKLAPVVESDKDSQFQGLDMSNPAVMKLVAKLVAQELASKKPSKGYTSTSWIVTPTKKSTKDLVRYENSSNSGSNATTVTPISSLVLASCSTRSRMEVVIYDLDKDVGMEVDKILVTLDLLAIPRNGNEDGNARPFSDFGLVRLKCSYSWTT